VPSQPTNKEDFCLKNWANVKLGWLLLQARSLEEDTIV
jgi:hypothetical protein